MAGYGQPRPKGFTKAEGTAATHSYQRDPSYKAPQGLYGLHELDPFVGP